MSTIRALFLRTAPIVFALVAAFAPRAASAQCLTCVQNLSLPSGPVSATTATNNNTVPAASGLGSFTVTLQGIGAGFDVTSGSYVAWCGDYPNTGLTTTPPTLYSTYSLNLPPLAQRPAGAWNEVNFILNNKTLGGTISPTVIDVQAAIWDILVPVFALTDPNVPQSANTALLVAQAELNPAYVPTQVVVVDLYVNGFQDVTSGKGLQYSTQDLIIEVPLDSIGDYVWQDTNENGIQDGGEPGINGVTLDLCADAGCTTILAQTTTNTYRGVQGMYEFAGLDAGTYYVSIPSGQSVLSGFVPSPVGQGTPGTDSNPNPSAVVLTPAAPSDQTVDFGFMPPGTSGIGDFVWDDSNGDGLQDNGEAGIPGVTVDLCSDAACANLIATTTTDGNGLYSFTSLLPGAYYVQVVAATLPPNFVPTTPFVGSDTSIDSNGSLNGSPAQVVLPADYTDNTIDFGFVPPALGIIGDFVWSDLNGNGIQDAGEPGINNVTVYLYSVQSSGNVLVGTTSTVTYNGADGYYQFTGLAAGTYSVVVDSTTLPPGGYTATTSNAPGSTTANDSNGSPATVVLATNSSVDETIDFGYVPPCTGSIGDLVWSDANTDGIPDNGEVGIPGVTVSLYTSPGNQFVVSTTTDANGAYEFSSVCAGTYAVTVAPPAGFTADSTKFPVSNNVPENVGSGAIVTLPVGGSYQNMDFGFYEQVNYNNQNCVTIGPFEVGVSVTSPNLVSNVTLGTGPYTFGLGIGPLPAGLAIDPATGILSGTPTASGTFTIVATDHYGATVFTTCPITVNAVLQVTCGSNTTGTVGVSFNSGPVTVSGGTPSYTFSIVGTLPTGLNLNASTGAVTGTPSVVGSFSVQVTDANGATSAGCPIVINAPPLSVNCNVINAAGTVGTYFNSGPMSVSGGTPSYTFSIVGTLPGNLSLNPSTGAVTGTPTSSGSFSIAVVDSKGVSSAGCPITINAGPVVVNCAAIAATGIVGSPFSSGPMSVSGGTPSYTFSIGGTLPVGLTLNTTTGAVTGTPSTSGTFTINVKDSKGVTGTGCPITIRPAVTANCAVITAQEGVTITPVTLTASGGTGSGYTFTASGLPAGLTISSSGTISGKPTVSGTFPYTVTIKDSANDTGTLNCSVTVGALSLTVSCPGGTAQQGVAYSSSVVASGGVPGYTYSVVAGALPSGLTLNSSTGAITGTPTVAGSFGFTIKATDSVGDTALSSCSSSCSVGVTSTWSFVSPVGKLGTSQAYTVGGIAVTAYGFTTSGTATDLYSQVVSGNEFGLGVYGASGNEIDTTHFVQLDLSAVIAAGATNPQAVVNSVQCMESYSIYGSNTLGSLGTLLQGGLTGDNNAFTIPNFPNYRYISIVAKSGTVLLASVSFNIGSCKIVVAASIDLQCGSCGGGNATVGVSYSSALAVVNGTSPYTFSLVSGSSLPPGLSLNTTTGAISGTPTTAGTYTFTSKVVDKNGNTDTQTCTIVVVGQPIDLQCGSCGTTGKASAGTFYSVAYAVVNGKSPYKFTLVSGSLPPGLTLNTTTGAISGTPTTAGTYTFTSTVVDANGNTDTQQCTITVTALPLDLECGACGTSGNATVGTSYSAAFAVTGGVPSYTFSIVSGSLPPGLSLNASTGKITGTPTTSGTYTFTAKVADSAGSTDTTTCTIKVTGSSVALVCGSCGSSGNATVGVSYSSALSASGGTSPYTYSISSGSLPPGLTLNTTTGVISGKPTTAGTYTFTSKVVDKNGKTDTTTCTVKVVGTPVDLSCGSCGSGNGSVGVAYSSTLSVTGGSSPYTYSITSGSLPPGLTLNTTTGVISGKPTTAGTYSFTSKVVDKNGNSDTTTCTVKIIGVSIDLECGACGTNDNATSGTAYSETLSVSGGTGPYTYSISSGSLPPGLTLNTSTGVVSGTPTTAGSYTFTSKVVDKNGNTDTATCTIKVTAPPLDIESGTCGSNKGQTGHNYSGTLQATGGSGGYNFSVSNGSLPNGLSLNSKTGTLSGTPTKSGTWVFTSQVTDSSGHTDTTNCIVVVCD